MHHARKGNTAIILILLIAVGGAGAYLYNSPDTAEETLPAQFLPMFPQFEEVQTEANCTRIEEGTDAVNQWVPEALLGGDELNSGEVKEKICEFQCSEEQTVAGTYCSDETLTCVCRN